MKSCKKIIALIIAVVMSFSTFAYLAGAEPIEGETAETASTIDPSDLTYVPPTFERPTGGPDFGDLFPSDALEEVGKGARSIIDFFNGLFLAFKNIINGLLEAVQELGDKLANRA